MKQVHGTVYVFDVDGVLCDIGEPINEEVLQRMAELLDQNVFVAINTGRSFDHSMPEILESVRSRVEDKAAIDHLFLASNMGGVTLHYEEGKPQITKTRFKLDEQTMAEVNRIFENNSFDTMSPRPKESMVTFIRNNELPEARFRQQQSELADMLREQLPEEDVIINITLESLDVHAPHAGKQAGAELIYGWLQRASDIQHDDFVCFGDNHSDYEMARWFAQQGCRTRFVYTGSELKVDEHGGVEVIDTKALYSEGTLEYLRANPITES